MSRSTGEQIRFRTRVWKRLRELGTFTDAEIADAWGLTQTLVRYHCGLGYKIKRERRALRARVWSRLVAAPYRMTSTAVAEIWDVSTALVCTEIRAVRYEMLARAA